MAGKIESILFRDLPSATVKALTALWDFRNIPAGQHIFHKGDPSDEMFLLLSGSVQVWDEHGGRQEIVNSFAEGELFSPGGFVGAKSVQTADAIAETPCEVLALPADMEVLSQEAGAAMGAALPIAFLRNLCWVVADIIQRRSWEKALYNILTHQEYLPPRDEYVLMENLNMDLSPEVRRIIWSKLTCCQFEPYMEIFKIDELSDSFYCLQKGRVKIQIPVSSREGGERLFTVASLGPGAIVGELGFLSGRPRSSTVMAVERTIAYCMSTPAWDDILWTQPDAARSFMIAILRYLVRFILCLDQKILRKDYSATSSSGPA